MAAAAPPPGVGCFMERDVMNWPRICFDVADDMIGTLEN